jgi:hypothetical protein
MCIGTYSIAIVGAGVQEDDGQKQHELQTARQTGAGKLHDKLHRRYSTTNIPLWYLKRILVLSLQIFHFHCDTSRNTVCGTGACFKRHSKEAKK